MEKLIGELSILVGTISASIILLVAYFLISRLIRFIMYWSKDNNKDLIIKTINEKNKIDKVTSKEGLKNEH